MWRMKMIWMMWKPRDEKRNQTKTTEQTREFMRIAKFLMSVLVCWLLGGALASAAGFDFATGGGLSVMVSLFAGEFLPMNALCAGVLTEIWTGELVKRNKAGLDGSWLDGIPNASGKVDNDVIHLVDVGAEPGVLVNNNQYPIAIVSQNDQDIAIQLDKFDTQNTRVTDDELHAISYDKIATVIENHGDALTAQILRRAAFRLCAAGNTATTPVLATSGAADGDGRKLCTVDDILKMKRAMDKLLVPTTGRRLVLCPAHSADLLKTSQAYAEQYKGIDRNTGRVGQLFGFEVYEFNANPIYKAGAKQAVTVTAEDAATGAFMCSFAFAVKRVFRASGSRRMYYHDALQDPENRQSLVGFRQYDIVMPKKADSGVVLTSGVSE